MNEQEITNYVLSLIPKEEKDRVFKQEYCAIGTDFIGFMETYYYLSKSYLKNILSMILVVPIIHNAIYFKTMQNLLLSIQKK